MACASCDACLRATGTCHEAQVRCERENPKDDTEHRASFRWSIQKESHGLPNESRLSCGAELEGSQGEFYHTARQTFSGSIGDGRRQLQALLGCAPQVIARVRPRQERRGALGITCLTSGL